ncbi:MAG: mannosyltransferase family protein [Cyanobacteria bacterium P01_H01_bin.15]
MASRLMLLTVGWLGQYVPLNEKLETEILARGWIFSANRLLDVWVRWDSGWYLSIINNGYQASTNIEMLQSNLAFFPLYPLTVRFLISLLPSALRTTDMTLFMGALVSNVCCLTALMLLYRLGVAASADDTIARRTVLYLLVFPYSFILSCLYAESIFLLFSVAAFYAAQQQKWGLAGVCGGLLALSRPLGVLILIPLVWQYAELHQWRWRQIRGSAAFLLLIPASLLAYLGWVGLMTGDFLAPIKAQAAWGRNFAFPWMTIFASNSQTPYLTPVEQIFALLSLYLIIRFWRRLPSSSYPIYALLLILPPLFTGSLTSFLRFLLVVFPAFMLLAILGKRPFIHRTIVGSFCFLQILLMIFWSQGYWLG